MAWELLRTDYKDAVWSGMRKFIPIDNMDGTFSYQDVTRYAVYDEAFFGAIDANRINEAVNAIMAALENGTDLYEAFQLFFNNQKLLFSDQLKKDTKEFEEYVEDLKQQGDDIIGTIKTDYRQEMDEFESLQQQLFTVWFDGIREKLTGDIATKLQKEIDDLNTKLDGFVPKTTVFSANGKHITETSGDEVKEIDFNTDGSITERMYRGGLLIHTKTTRFSPDGTEIKEEVS